MFSRLTATQQLFRQLKNVPKLQTIRNSGHGTWVYRTGTPVNKRMLYLSEGIMGFMWWWILWHLWTEPEHVLGEWPDIDPLKWTDEDLGIPPDDVGPAPRINQ